MKEKDYILIADVLNTQYKRLEEAEKDENYRFADMINDFSRKLKADNDKFDKEKFVQAILKN